MYTNLNSTQSGQDVMKGKTSGKITFNTVWLQAVKSFTLVKQKMPSRIIKKMRNYR